MRAALAIVVAVLLTAPAMADHGLGVVAANQQAPTPAEVKAVVEGVEGTPGMAVHEIGKSSQDRPIYVVEIVDPESNVSMEERATVFIMTQQHGNEPAGTPAALALLEDLKAGHVTVPADVVLLVMPQSNPDGALTNSRAGAHGEDINRDHVDIGTPESTAIHAVLKQWDVHMAFDHHEYGGSGYPGHPSPVGSYDYDITTMWPNHGNVRTPTADMSLAVNEAIKSKLADEGYTHGDYGITGARVLGTNVAGQQVAGGPDPGILRNSYGLNNVAGLLIESFVPPASDQNPFQSFDRRVASQRVVMDAVIEFAAKNGPAIIEAKRESERLNLEEPMSQYIEASTQSPLKAFFGFTNYEETLQNAFHRHGLPEPATDDQHGHVVPVAQHRGGLIAAMLHPDSSRNMVDGVALDDVDLPATYYQDAQFGYVEPEVEVEPVGDDQDANGLGLVVLVAALAAVVMARRR